MTKQLLFFLSPLLLLMELQLLSWITQLLRQPSDPAVFGGVLLLCVAVVGNYYLIKLIQNQCKQTTQ